MKNPTITTLPAAPDVDRHHRMVKYLVAMGVRVLCIVALLFVHGWWLIVPAIGAIFLPYFAVVIANAATSPSGGRVERPGNIVLLTPQPSAQSAQPTPPTPSADTGGGAAGPQRPEPRDDEDGVR